MASTSETVGVRLSLSGQGQTSDGLKRTSRDVRGIGEAALLSKENLDVLGSGLSRLGGIARTGALVGATALAGLATTAAVVGVKTASFNEQAQIAFSSMLGSATEAKSYLADLRNFANATPFRFEDVTKGAQRLVAMGVAAKDVKPYLTAIGDAVAGQGGGADEIERVTLAIGQMQAKGKIQNDEILQLTEAGIPALKILAAQYGITTAQLSKFITNNQVSSDDALPKLISGLEKGTKASEAFGGMMDAQSKTIAGRWGTLQDQFSTGLGASFEHLMPTIGEFMDKTAATAPRFFDGLSSLFDQLSQNGPSTIDAMFSGVGNLRDEFDRLKPTLSEAWGDLQLIGQAFGEAFSQNAPTQAQVNQGFSDMKTTLDPNGPLVQGLTSTATLLGDISGSILTISTYAGKAWNVGTTPFIDLNGATKMDAPLINTKGLQAAWNNTAAPPEQANQPSGKPVLSWLSKFVTGSGFKANGTDVFAGARAAGGNVQAGSLYRVNEAGVEGFRPSMPGKIVPTPLSVRGSLADVATPTVIAQVLLDRQELTNEVVGVVRRNDARRVGAR